MFWASIYVSFTLFGYRAWGEGIGTQPIMQFFSLGRSKIEVPQIIFFDIVTTHNGHLKHVLGSLYVFYPIWVLGVQGGGGGILQGIGAQPAYVVFHPGQLKNRSFRNFFFDIVTIHNDHPSYVKHVLGSLFICAQFGHLVLGGGGGHC